MATRSTIALEFADGTIGKVYCHWDGYLSNNGRILLEHWIDPFKLQHLIELGDLSLLSSEIGEKHEFDNPYKWGTDEFNTHRAKFAHMCLFYGRDRGESDVAPRYYKDFEDYKQNAQFEEYNYILRRVDEKAVWFVASYVTDDRFVPLVEAIAEEANERETAE